MGWDSRGEGGVGNGDGDGDGDGKGGGVLYDLLIWFDDVVPRVDLRMGMDFLGFWEAVCGGFAVSGGEEAAGRSDGGCDGKRTL